MYSIYSHLADCMGLEPFVTGPEKTGLIYTKYIYSYYGAYLFFCARYAISVNCIEFLKILCIYDEIRDEMLCC